MKELKIDIQKVELTDILPLRDLYLQECNFQIRYHSCHIRNWSDSYLIFLSGEKVGYGSVKGLEKLADRDSIFEFYLLPQFSNKSSIFFAELLKRSQAAFLECQSNDLILSPMMYEFGKEIESEVILFGESHSSQIAKEEVTFRPIRKGEEVFGKKDSDKGAYVLEFGGKVIADGGFLTHYNHPFVDLYMEVAKDFRGKGYGAYILQEIKKCCYAAAKIPAARCNISNPASKVSLLNAGMQIVGYMLKGKAK
ncbi:MAG: GNAT family N-acetyltransferase [Bacteroidota bacterium]